MYRAYFKALMHKTYTGTCILLYLPSTQTQEVLINHIYKGLIFNQFISEVQEDMGEGKTLTPT